MKHTGSDFPPRFTSDSGVFFFVGDLDGFFSICNTHTHTQKGGLLTWKLILVVAFYK